MGQITEDCVWTVKGGQWKRKEGHFAICLGNEAARIHQRTEQVRRGCR